MRELGALKNLQVWLTLAVGAVGFGGMFAVFTYITPTLVEVSGVPLRWAPAALACFGAGMIIGNIVGPHFADRGVTPTYLWRDRLERRDPGAVFGRGALGVDRRPVRAADRHRLRGGSGAADPVDGRWPRGADAGGGAEPFRAQHRQRLRSVARRRGDRLAGMGHASTGWVGALLALAGLAVFAFAVAIEKRRTEDSSLAVAKTPPPPSWRLWNSRAARPMGY